MNTLTQAMQDWMIEMLGRADSSNDVKTKVDADGKYIRTPWELCFEILGNIKQSVTDLSNKKILVVDTVEFIPVLLAFGVNKCNIVFVAPYEFKGKIASSLGVTVVQESLLTWKPNMKFDVVIGNPPYQDITGQNTIYPKFYNKSVENLKTDGIIAFITPPAIIPGIFGKKGVDGHTMVDPITTLYICVGDRLKTFFPTVGGEFCYFIQSNSKALGTATVKTDTDTLIVSGPLFAKKTPNIPLAQSIFNKCFEYLGNPYSVGYSDHGKQATHVIGGADKAVVSISSNGTVTLRDINWIGNRTHSHYGKPKVMLPLYGSVAVAIKDHSLVSAAYDKNAKLSGHNVATVITKNDAESDNLVSIINSNLQKFFVIAAGESRSGSVAFLQHIKLIDISRTWTDAELYTHFNLTQEEIDYIEDITKG